MDGQENNTEFSEQSAILKHLTSKWTPIVLMHLSATPITFGRLRRKIPKISQRMLTQTLRTLERDKLIMRCVLPTYPPSVEYALTEMGNTFRDKVISLNQWAKEIIYNQKEDS
jgi:DNA-binding HxlR family transcriptional regulator